MTKKVKEVVKMKLIINFKIKIHILKVQKVVAEFLKETNYQQIQKKDLAIVMIIVFKI